MNQNQPNVPESAGPEPVRSKQLTTLRVLVRLGVAALVLVLGWGLAPSLSNHDLFLWSSILVWALIASSLNVAVGYAGQLNLAQGGFLALGAYTGVLGTGRWEWPGEVSLLVAGLLAFAVSWCLGLIIFRARGLHFALLTAGISIVVYNLAVVWTDLTGGSAGTSTAGPLEEGGVTQPFTLFGLEVRTGIDYFRVFFIALVLLVLALSFLVHRKQGLSWQAIRDDEVLAASVGVSVARGKRRAFVVSSVLAALIGVVMGHWLGYITPASFDFATASFAPLAMVIIGGAGSLAGPIIGAVLMTGSPEVFGGLESHSVLVYGLLLLVVVLLAPKGVVGILSDLWRRTVALVKGRNSK